MNTTNSPAEVFAPGEFLRDELDARGWSQLDLAQILAKSPAFVSELLFGKRGITPETAQALADALGTSPELWMNLESAYRLSLARGHDEGIAHRARLYEKAPVNDMLKRKWLAATDNARELESNILQFLEITSLESEPSLVAAARKSTSYEATTPSQMAWFYRAKHIASTLPVKTKYRKELLVERLPDIRALAAAPEELRRLPALLEEVGIRFVVVEHLPKTKIDGAAFWLSDGADPVIVLSLRYDRIDAFWHSFTHELAHIFCGHGLALDSNLVGADKQRFSDKPQIEQVADEMACSFLIPPAELDAFIARTRPLYSKVKINQFANRIRIFPGIIVGQLQHREEIGYQHSREMLVKIREIVTNSAITDGWGFIPDNS